MPSESPLTSQRLQGVAEFSSHKVDINGGPVWLFFQPVATHPGAKHEEIFGVAAAVCQNGKTLATFGALALEEFRQAPDWWLNGSIFKESGGPLLRLPQVKNNQTLNAAFGDFLLWVWQQVWQAFEPALPDRNGYKLIEDIVPAGVFHVVHSGFFMHVESSFFHRAMPDDAAINEVFGYRALPSIQHPFHLQKFSSLAVGMGYCPDISDKSGVNEALGWTDATYLNPVEGVRQMSELLELCKRRDSRLEPFRIRGW